MNLTGSEKYGSIYDAAKGDKSMSIRDMFLRRKPKQKINAKFKLRPLKGHNMKVITHKETNFSEKDR